MKFIMDLHTHTVSSSHAFSTLEENVKSAAKKGLAVMGTSDHGGKMPGAAHDFLFMNYRVVPTEWHGIRLLRGVEANITNVEGKLDIKNPVVKAVDYMIASIHQPVYKVGTVEENTAAYVNAMKHDKVIVLGHPDDDRIPLDYEVLAKAAKEEGVALELNNSSQVPNSVRKNAKGNAIKLLQAAKKHGAQILLGSDAHIQLDVGRFAEAAKLIEAVDFPEELIVNTSLEKLDALLKHNGCKGILPEDE